MQYKSKGMNCLEMIDLSRNILACDNILVNEHPEWSKKDVFNRGFVFITQIPETGLKKNCCART